MPNENTTKNTNNAGKASHKMTPEQRKAKALPNRIFAIIFWCLGIALEIFTFLNIRGTINIPVISNYLVIFVILFIILAIVLVIIGSQFWRKANQINPPSDENKNTYWLSNQIGLLISIVVFVPIVILLLVNKDLDKKSKRISTIVAVIALVIDFLACYNF